MHAYESISSVQTRNNTIDGTTNDVKKLSKLMEEKRSYC
uniref:Uncharacterized protein n=1 Tax=Arundo donax TaxID=35708 RepID=A0A0A9A8N7_ARUDO